MEAIGNFPSFHSTPNSTWASAPIIFRSDLNLQVPGTAEKVISLQFSRSYLSSCGIGHKLYTSGVVRECRRRLSSLTKPTSRDRAFVLRLDWVCSGAQSGGMETNPFGKHTSTPIAPRYHLSKTWRLDS